MTDDVTDDLWVGKCADCGQQYQIFDNQLVDTYPELMLLVDEADEFMANCATCQAATTLVRQTGKVGSPHLWHALPPESECLACGCDHDPGLPHNWQSLQYEAWFRTHEAQAGRQQRAPTIQDAMAHCTPEVQNTWIEALQRKGIKV